MQVPAGRSMSRRPFLTIVSVMVFFAPSVARAADPVIQGESDEKQAEIDRTWRRGTGLFWGGVGVGAAGGLTLFGIIPANRSFLVAEGRLERCLLYMESDPFNVDCQPDQDELIRRGHARTAIAVVGSVIFVGGVALLGTGIWMRRKARRWQQEHDRRYQPEWALLPRLGVRGVGLEFHLRF